MRIFYEINCIKYAKINTKLIIEFTQLFVNIISIFKTHVFMQKLKRKWMRYSANYMWHASFFAATS